MEVYIKTLKKYFMNLAVLKFSALICVNLFITCNAFYDFSIRFHAFCDFTCVLPPPHLPGLLLSPPNNFST